MGDNGRNSEERGLRQDVAAFAAEQVGGRLQLQDLFGVSVRTEGDLVGAFQGFEVVEQFCVLAADRDDGQRKTLFHEELAELLHLADAVAPLRHDDGEVVLGNAETAAQFLLALRDPEGLVPDEKRDQFQVVLVVPPAPEPEFISLRHTDEHEVALVVEKFVEPRVGAVDDGQGFVFLQLLGVVVRRPVGAEHHVGLQFPHVFDPARGGDGADDPHGAERREGGAEKLAGECSAVSDGGDPVICTHLVRQRLLVFCEVAVSRLGEELGCDDLDPVSVLFGEGLDDGPHGHNMAESGLDEREQNSDFFQNPTPRTRKG